MISSKGAGVGVGRWGGGEVRRWGGEEVRRDGGGMGLR